MRYPPPADCPAPTTFEVRGDSLVVAGDVDDVICDAFAAALNTAGIRYIDMSQVTFFNSAGIRTLVNKQRHRSDGGFVIVHPSRSVRRVLELTGLTWLTSGESPDPDTGSVTAS